MLTLFRLITTTDNIVIRFIYFLRCYVSQSLHTTPPVYAPTCCHTYKIHPQHVRFTPRRHNTPIDYDIFATPLFIIFGVTKRYAVSTPYY